MPRSGPRPYECIRRAWHSDRHQPVRGSLIKEIFSVANEIHSSATRKNKEWQEKLPIVVLKAEEIMYSKANSEAEYTDLKTLWDRANDAINTIIRRDESIETGEEFLQPCIEAALNLGCVARRASRSQRYSNPRCYLSPITSDVPSVVEKSKVSNPQYTPHCSNFVKPITINSTHLGPESTMKSTSAAENVPPCGYDQCSPRDIRATSNISSYPLYYGNCPQFEELKHGFVSLPKPVPNPIKPAKMSVIPNLFRNGDKPSNSTQKGPRDYPDQSPDTIGCDLSLRLGSLSSRCLGSESNPAQKVKDVGAQEGSKCTDQPSQLDKELSFFPKGNDRVPIGSNSGRWSFEGEFMNVQSTMRKRKADFNHPTEDTKFCRQPELPFSRLTGSMGNGDL
ncbi:putative coactivator CBP, KIX domain-containing protein [Rosa chinensis]|uniref:Putative coactivator CBP, KIX domain-containing protein n=1 Tax=Rosa chinensis TaxID=74649 RepID=A0A2P6PXU4_ROSCH|nr:uncharacterized protein LOC112171991 isoform X1 [Rosa chinensis]XP_040364827.1 uncharacterized protein LOC112171991 isoform X1 [Rosa chinensis]PRQ26739.1 putative coactivator CBP, KIX domain-containing protein [Rosa chinensis]